MRMTATTKATALTIAIVQALPAFSLPVRSPVTAMVMTAKSGRNRRLSSWTTPYRAMPDVAGMFGTPQPRTTTQTTPMFQGPNGTLAPIPLRISHDVGPRRTESPGMSAQKTSPLTSQASAPRIVMMTICCSESAWKAARTSR